MYKFSGWLLRISSHNFFYYIGKKGINGYFDSLTCWSEKKWFQSIASPNISKIVYCALLVWVAKGCLRLSATQFIGGTCTRGQHGGCQRLSWSKRGRHAPRVRDMIRVHWLVTYQTIFVQSFPNMYVYENFRTKYIQMVKLSHCVLCRYSKMFLI